MFYMHLSQYQISVNLNKKIALIFTYNITLCK
jgi:hypothetical protein